MSYAGDLTPQEAWEMLSEQSNVLLVDVRTVPEWNYVGIPDLSSIGKETHLVSWIEFPHMTENQNFVDQISQLAPDQSTPILMLCRSGVRSIASAEIMTVQGYTACYNVLQGFEGDMDDARHRSSKGGWKKANLPWIQN
mgnify:CR=1 FL=1